MVASNKTCLGWTEPESHLSASGLCQCVCISCITPTGHCVCEDCAGRRTEMRDTIKGIASMVYFELCRNCKRYHYPPESGCYEEDPCHDERCLLTTHPASILHENENSRWT